MPENVGNYQVYPRGFLGCPTPELASSRTGRLVPKTQTFMYQVRVFDPGSDLVSSQAVNEFYAEMHGRVYQLGKLQYRKRVFREAFVLFNSPNFTQWLRVQASSPLYSSTHRDFLIDTVRYITEGKRKVSLHNWLSLLTHSNNPYMHQTLPFSKEENKLLESNSYLLDDNAKTFARWASHDGGMEDFVQCLYLFFGALQK